MVCKVCGPKVASSSFGPDELEAMTATYEGALIDLGLNDRGDPLTQLVAKSIVAVTGTHVGTGCASP
jgi:hypothetical protein